MLYFFFFCHTNYSAEASPSSEGVHVDRWHHLGPMTLPWPDDITQHSPSQSGNTNCVSIKKETVLSLRFYLSVWLPFKRPCGAKSLWLRQTGPTKGLAVDPGPVFPVCVNAWMPVRVLSLHQPWPPPKLYGDKPTQARSCYQTIKPFIFPSGFEQTNTSVLLCYPLTLYVAIERGIVGLNTIG